MQTNHRTLKIGLTSLCGSIVGASSGLALCLEYNYFWLTGLVLGLLSGLAITGIVFCALHPRRTGQALLTAYDWTTKDISRQSLEDFGWATAVGSAAALTVVWGIAGVLAVISVYDHGWTMPTLTGFAYNLLGTVSMSVLLGFCIASIFTPDNMFGTRQQRIKWFRRLNPLSFYILYPLAGILWTLINLRLIGRKFIRSLVAIGRFCKMFVLLMLSRELYVACIGTICGTIFGLSYGLKSGDIVMGTVCSGIIGFCSGMAIFEGLSKRILKLVPMKV